MEGTWTIFLVLGSELKLQKANFDTRNDGWASEKIQIFLVSLVFPRVPTSAFGTSPFSVKISSNSQGRRGPGGTRSPCTAGIGVWTVGRVEGASGEAIDRGEIQSKEGIGSMRGFHQPLHYSFQKEVCSQARDDLEGVGCNVFPFEF